MSRRRKPRKVLRGALYLLALLFVSAGGLRLYDGVSAALAEGGAPGVQAAPDSHAVPAQAPAEGHAMATPTAIADGEGLDQLLRVLQAREAEVARREQAAAAREEELALAEKAIEDNLRALVEAERALEATLALADGAMEEDIGRLTQVYETMKPRDAAALFEQMDPTFAAGFLARMKPASAAGIMAGLSPEAAYSISILYAGRHRDVPKD